MTINIILLVIGGLVLFLGLVSGLLKRWGLPEPLIALITGILLSPTVSNVLDPSDWGEPGTILREVTRFTLAIGLMGVALRIPAKSPFRQWRDILVLLLVVMPLMCLTSSLIVYAFLKTGFWLALLTGAVVTPTDPIVASSIVTGKVAKENLPQRLQNLISSESGFNDGLAYLLVFLPFLFIQDVEAPIREWIVKVLLQEVLGSVAIGILVGIAAGKLLKWAESKKFIERPSLLAFTISLAFFTVSIVRLLGSDGILAVFVCGLSLNQVIDLQDRQKEERVTEGIDRFFTLPIFTLLGLLLPFQEWIDMGWKAVAIVVLILLFRRLPWLLLFRKSLKSVQNLPEAMFTGWFGPIGVAAIFYANLNPDFQSMDQLWQISSLMAAASIFFHGMTATLFTKWLGREKES